MAATGRHRHSHRRRKPNDRGSVTVEAAIGMAAFLLVLALALSGVAAAVDQIRVVDAAREAARLAARGEPDEGRAAAERIAPPDAEVAIDVNGEHIQVDVSATPMGGLLPGVRLHAQAFAVREPGG
jgi:Flp pilus assembly protein TadG